MRTTGARRRTALVAIAAFAVLASVLPARPASADPRVLERERLGDSRQGRPIRVVHAGDPAEPRVLVVGCIHGDECAGSAIARRLLAGGPRHFVDLWVVPNLNPDGRASGTRQNARGVDLNRNFPYRWEPGPRGRYYPGPRPMSEPETRIAAALVRRIEPDVTIWFHQPLALVDPARRDPVIERRYARLVGLPLVALERLHGTATSWQNHTFRGTTAFVVELPGGPLAPRRVRVFARAVFELARTLG
jgi:protein MpaA